MKKYLPYISMLFIVVAAAGAFYFINYGFEGTSGEESNETTKQQVEENTQMMPSEQDGEAMMREHCKMMPEMKGCEKYK